MTALIDHRKDMDAYLADKIYNHLEDVLEHQGLFDFNVVTTENDIIEASYIPVPEIQPIVLTSVITSKGATFFQAMQEVLAEDKKR